MDSYFLILVGLTILSIVAYIAVRKIESNVSELQSPFIVKPLSSIWSNSGNTTLSGDDLLNVVWTHGGTIGSNYTLTLPTAVETVAAAKAIGLANVGQKFKFQVYVHFLTSGTSGGSVELTNPSGGNNFIVGPKVSQDQMAIYDVILLDVNSGSEGVLVALQTISNVTHSERIRAHYV
jgi:hypothetical protein